MVSCEINISDFVCAKYECCKCNGAGPTETKGERFIRGKRIIRYKKGPRNRGGLIVYPMRSLV